MNKNEREKENKEIIETNVDESWINLTEKDTNHPVEDIYQLDEGEGNADSADQVDVADTGEHGLGDSGAVDNSNIEENEKENSNRNL